MVDQATQIAEGHDAQRESGLATLVGDVVRLGQLQTMLVAAESKRTLRRLILPAGLLICGGAVALGAAPIFLAAVAAGLVAAGLAWGWALLIAGAIGVAFAAMAALGGWYTARKSLSGLVRSQTELMENVKSIRQAFRRQNGSPSR